MVESLKIKGNIMNKIMLIIVTLTMLISQGFSFKVTSHVAVANKTLDDITKSFAKSSTTNKLEFHGIEFDVYYDDGYQAILNYPDYFRMGVTGPDAFPDMVGGQQVLHTNNGELNHGFPLLTKVKHEERILPSQYRSIDFAMKLLKKAKDSNEPRNLSFALGYIGHCVGDGFMHTQVNEWASGAFDYFGGDGLYGTLSEEVKHIASEGFVDHNIPDHLRTNLNLKAPYDFLDDFFSEFKEPDIEVESLSVIYNNIKADYPDKYQDILDNCTTWERSTFILLKMNPFKNISGSCENYENRVKLSKDDQYLNEAEQLRQQQIAFKNSEGEHMGGMVYDWFKWQENMLNSIEPSIKSLIHDYSIVAPFSLEAVEYLLDDAGLSWAKVISNDILNVVTQSPITDYSEEIDDNIEDLRGKLQAYRRNWAVLSKCTMQNLVKAYRKDANDNCVDAISDLSFVGIDGSDLNLFKVELENLFKMHDGGDHNKVGDNVKRAKNYLISSLKIINLDEILIPSKIREGWVKFKQMMNEQLRKEPLNSLLKVEAQKLMAYECAGNVLVCNERCIVNECAGKIYNCMEGSQNWCDTYSGCGMVNNKTICQNYGLGELCSPSLRDGCHKTNPAYQQCMSITGLKDVGKCASIVQGCENCSDKCAMDMGVCETRAVKKLWSDDRSIDLINKSMDNIIALGDEAKQIVYDMIEITACQRAKKHGLAIEEFHRTYNMYKSLELIAEQGEYALVNFAFMQEDLQDIQWYNQLVASNPDSEFINFLNEIRDGSAGSYDGIYKEFEVDVPEKCLEFSFEPNGAFYKDPRFQNFYKSTTFATIPGPTAKTILNAMGGNVPDAFMPFYNATQATKLIPLSSKTDIEKIFDQAGARKDFLPWNNNENYSATCYDVDGSINVFCDAIISLDDPNCFNCEMPTTDAPSPLTHEWLINNLEPELIHHNGEYVTWMRRRGLVAWNDEGSSYSSTSFLFANHPEVTSKIYTKIFKPKRDVNIVPTIITPLLLN